MSNKLGNCGQCNHYRDLRCMNPASPYGGKPRIPSGQCWAFKSKLTFQEEAARDIALMHENIREGYMPEQSQAVIDAYRAALQETSHD